MHTSMMFTYVGCGSRKRSEGICLCDTEGKGVCVCACVNVCVGALACELVVEVDYQRVVPPIKGGEQMKETKEADLRRTEEDREIHSHDLLNEQREVEKTLSTNGTGEVDILLKCRSGSYPGGVKGAGCRKSDATSRSAVSSVTSSLKS